VTLNIQISQLIFVAIVVGGVIGGIGSVGNSLVKSRSRRLAMLGLAQVRTQVPVHVRIV